jgi:glucan phosphoethanolaminetransferase (alkaline phosphatase superfamily)
MSLLAFAAHNQDVTMPAFLLLLLVLAVFPTLIFRWIASRKERSSSKGTVFVATVIAVVQVLAFLYLVLWVGVGLVLFKD